MTAPGSWLIQCHVSAERLAELQVEGAQVDSHLDNHLDLAVCASGDFVQELLNAVDACNSRVCTINGLNYTRREAVEVWAKLGRSVKEEVYEPWLKEMEARPGWNEAVSLQETGSY